MRSYLWSFLFFWGCSVLIIQSSLAIPVSVMLPLNTVGINGSLEDPTTLQNWLKQCKQGGIDGVMSDVWWGIVEQAGPQQYNWAPYLQLANYVKQAGLTLQVVMSFHECGGNVGDDCDIPLPPWVLQVGYGNSDIFYKDQTYSPDSEYLSLGVDNQTLFSGRDAIQIYTDFMSSFAKTFVSYLGSNNVINEIQVGLGPSGELRYPAYQSSKWTYCGIGEFQCYDKYMLGALQNAANAAGHPEWGHGGPNDAGSYDSYPSQTGFFTDGTSDNYASPYGEFFIGWYSNMLIQHADHILSEAHKIFYNYGVELAAKVAGIHWWYATDNHAAEVTAGYFNTDNDNAYAQIATVFAKYNVNFDFTCLEMTDSSNCASAPQELVKQTIYAAKGAGIKYCGENALDCCAPTCNQGAFNEIYTESTQYGTIHRFTYLRMTDALMDNPSNWNTFTSFVARMHSAGSS
mmetsp:Transcript_21021/g.29487  ORF Transcript_21021/g.29487 Transcript_21021/m.29487 type:complete len:458 (-) Transcript_21021:87-1460(-)